MAQIIVKGKIILKNVCHKIKKGRNKVKNNFNYEYSTFKFAKKKHLKRMKTN